MRSSVGARTDVGRVREGNEDSLLVDAPLFVVADGMGGHLGGEVASATAIEIIAEAADDETEEIGRALETYVKRANSTIYEKAAADPRLQGMGTTCTVLYVRDSTAHIAHVGDSRAYLLRDGDLQQVTEDHTLVERMVREGRLRREEAAHHPQRSIITRALGVDARVEVDLQDLPLQPKDRVLMCSDGLTSMLDEAQIMDILQAGEDSQTTADRLVESANEAGGDDNITVIVLDIGTEDDAPPAPANVRQETDRDAAPPAPTDGNRDAGASYSEPSRWRRAVVIGVVLLLVLAAGGYALLRYSLDRSWFVGANDNGSVAIFKGRPEEVAGFELRDLQEESDLLVADLPEHLKDNVEEGIKVSSLEEAQEKVSDLEDRVQDFGGRPDGTNERTRSEGN